MGVVDRVSVDGVSFGFGQDLGAARTKMLRRKYSLHPWSIRACSLPCCGLGLYILLYESRARDAHGVVPLFLSCVPSEHKVAASTILRPFSVCDYSSIYSSSCTCITPTSKKRLPVASPAQAVAATGAIGSNNSDTIDGVHVSDLIQRLVDEADGSVAASHESVRVPSVRVEHAAHRPHPLAELVEAVARQGGPNGVRVVEVLHGWM